MIKIITQQAKPMENPNIYDIKSITIGDPKISRELDKSIR